MVMDRERTLSDVEEMKKDFLELKSEMLSNKDLDPELKEDVDYMALSIDVLLDELNQVKAQADLTPKKNIKIDALLTWVGQFLPNLAGDAEFDEDDFDDEDFDDEDFEEEEEEEEEKEDNNFTK